MAWSGFWAKVKGVIFAVRALEAAEVDDGVLTLGVGVMVLVAVVDHGGAAGGVRFSKRVVLVVPGEGVTYGDEDIEYGR